MTGFARLLFIVCWLGQSPGAEEPASLVAALAPIPPKEPAEALRTFELKEGFRIDLVATEPLVVDPIAAAFDEAGRLYVAEMIDYPFKPTEGDPPLGRVRLLVDTTGDGVFDTASAFAEELLWPAGIACWRGGVFVAACPHIYYFKDTDGDGRADERRVAYTGFGTQNQQAMVNNLAWGLDQWIYGSTAANGGKIRPGDNPNAEPIDLDGSDFRFHPPTGHFEAITGRAQFGNTFDDYGRRFLCSESVPTYQEVLPRRYLARNPYLPVAEAMKRLVDGVTPIYRSSPIEAWRAIRTQRRMLAGERDAGAAGASHHVLDGAAGVTIYRGDAFPAEFRGNLFIGDAQNNLVHRRRLEPRGVLFDSARAEEGTEFLRSSDNWFRPVNFVNAPDGTLYLLDMAREIIESIHIPTDVFQRLDLTRGRDRGRIYRIAPAGRPPAAIPTLKDASTSRLVNALTSTNGWHSDTATRLLVERRHLVAEPGVRGLLFDCPAPLGRLHALYVLAGLDRLTDADLIQALNDPTPEIREHAVRLSEPRLPTASVLRRRILELADDNDVRVRFQVAFTLGEMSGDDASASLARLAARDGADRWCRIAILSSAADRADQLLAGILTHEPFEPSVRDDLARQLAAIVGTRGKEEELARLVATASGQALSRAARVNLLLGAGEGLKRRGETLENLIPFPGGEALCRESVAWARAECARSESAIQLLGYCSLETAQPSLASLLDAERPLEVQHAAIRALGGYAEPGVAALLLAAAPKLDPSLKARIAEVVLARKAWLDALLDALEREEWIALDLTPAQWARLAEETDPTRQPRIARLLPAGAADRRLLIERYKPALALGGDAGRGESIFEKHCANCHRLGNKGHPIGPNLATTKNKSADALLVHILDPNREVQPNYTQHIVALKDGRVLTGLLADDTASSITLRREQDTRETILRSDIDSIHDSGRSLMPDGLEKSIAVEQMADLIAYLATARYDIGSEPGFVEPGGR